MTHSPFTNLAKVKGPAHRVRTETNISSTSNPSQKDSCNDFNNNHIYNHSGMIADCDESYLASIPSSNHNNHGLITFIQIQLHEVDPRAFFSPHQDSLSVNWDTGSTFSMWRYASDIVCLIPLPFACHCHEGSISDLNIAEMSTVRWTFCLMMSSFWSSVYRHLLSIVANNS